MINKCLDTGSRIFPRASAQLVERKGGMKFSLVKTFIVSADSSLWLISCLLRDGVIFRLFELGGEMGLSDQK
jgi:hypothetical protein